MITWRGTERAYGVVRGALWLLLLVVVLLVLVVPFYLALWIALTLVWANA